MSGRARSEEAGARIHITGASGSGTSTLGRALCARFGLPHFDTDSYFWLPTDPPFQTAWPMPDRLERLAKDLRGQASWVLSGWLCGWGDPLISRFDLVVFLHVPTPIRLARLRAREERLFGREALEPGGRMHERHAAFLEWTARYDTAGIEIRGLARHTAWLATLACPVLRLLGEMPIDREVEMIAEALEVKG